MDRAISQAKSEGHDTPLNDAGRHTAGEAGEAVGIDRIEILRWIYIFRISLAGGLFAGAVFAWAAASPEQTLTASLALVITLLHTPASYWVTHIRRQPIGASFIYGQAVLDVVLVTLVVDLTGGSDSVVAPLYILLISVYTLMLPLRGGFLVTGLACMAYIADSVWVQGTAINTVVFLQLAIFVAVALVVGLISTKLRQAGAALTSVEYELERLRVETGDILGNIPTAVLTIDGLGRLVYANPAAEMLLGLEARDWLERPVLEELARCSSGLQQALERTRRFRMPVASAEIAIHRDGDAVPVGISTAVLERREGPPSVTAIMRDISDVKRVERLRQRTERLEAVAELSASLAHEIKNPLASISSSVQQLGLRERADDDDRLLSRLILKESNRLSRLLSDFIDFARLRIERSKDLDLRELVKHSVEVVRQHPDCGDAIEIDLELGPQPVFFEGDEDLMHRVISNLVLNAVQAAPAGRPIRVAVEVYGQEAGLSDQVDVDTPVVLRISDNGPGIPEDDLKRIFDPFFTRRRGGSGLGLAIVHRAVREHRGAIMVSSEPDVGTRFTVYLPGKPETPREALGEERT